ncbi:RNB domain-containing ribonuclease [Psychromicrobium lacuslunae]|uniref:Ribonuclease II n=1 Tax=Psychromicrobium lacuslunae TaxID=1618207 RepID=A0A0D4BYP2_9MICC|nr:RNB domain-containing ribonuclease [Psychromicrobium lacuslunae]AJT41542.1 ribonuclease II [Psychromicrobium lacuslunae]
MPHSQIVVPDDDVQLKAALAQLRVEFKLEEQFSDEVMAELSNSLQHHKLPELDLSQLPFITIDPPGSMDLDQAMYLERTPSGYRVHYAIADVPSFVPPNGALDAETRRRGQTIYTPDGRIPLHPAEMSEAAASLLADQLRGAFVWQIELDQQGQTSAVAVRRAQIKSIARLDYQQAQQELEAGTSSDYLSTLQLLKEIGQYRIELERQRGGASLNTPQQEVAHANGGYQLIFRPALAIEDWNAQISLLTGMAAAQLMLDGKVGLLRTMPAPDQAALEKFRAQAVALGKPWPAGMAYGEFLRSLDIADPRQLALMHAATSLFRGAAYTSFDGTLPEHTVQAAVAASYAHTTAPLRRLVDRFVLTTCAALSAGEPVPDWVREALPRLPELMSASDQLAGQVERAALDIVEAALLSSHLGEEFDAVVVAGPRKTAGRAEAANGPATAQTAASRPELARCTVQIQQPAVAAPCQFSGEVEVGSTVKVKLLTADITKREVLFELVSSSHGKVG